MVLFAIIRSRCGWDLRWRSDSAPPSGGNLSEIGIANRSILRKAAAASGVRALRADLKKRPRNRLNAGAKTAAGAVKRDYEEWRS